MPLAKGHIAATTFVYRGRILALAGEIANGKYTDEDAAYDPVTDTWVELTPFPVATFSGIARPMLGGFVYTTGNYTAEMCLYDRDKSGKALHDDICKTYVIVVP